MKIWILTSMLLLMTTPAVAGSLHPSHAPLDKILQAHVKNGRVNYAAIKARDLDTLDAYIKAIGCADLEGLNRQGKLAFYLNAYNALVIKSVIHRMPLASVKGIKGFFDGARHKVAGKSLTLNDLENKIIRPRFKEPRIHFALVCAARSCPPLMSRAFTAKSVNRDLERLTRRFLNASTGVVIKDGKVAASQLFSWYAEDFVKAAGSVAAYLAKYRPGDAEALGAKGLKIAFLEYDWKLNGP